MRAGMKETVVCCNRSPEDKTWSAIPVALLSIVVNQNEKEGSGPEGDKVL